MCRGLNTKTCFHILLFLEKVRRSLCCVMYLPLPLLLDISLSFWSLLHQPNVMLASTLSQLKCFYCSTCPVWHECAAECTVDLTLWGGHTGVYETGCLSYVTPPELIPSKHSAGALHGTLGVFINVSRDAELWTAEGLAGTALKYF